MDFLDGSDREALRRTWRIRQQEKSFVWRYITKGNTEERMVRRRQELRAGILKRVFKLPTTHYEFRKEDLDNGQDDVNPNLFA